MGGDRRNNPIDANQVKVQIQDQVNKNMSNPKASEAAANFINREIIDKGSKDLSSNSQSQYMQKPQPAVNNPVGAAARQMGIAKYAQNQIEEDDEGEYEEENELEQNQLAQNQLLQQKIAQQQRAAQQQLAAQQQRSAPSKIGQNMQSKGALNYA